MNEVTQLLDAASRGEANAADELLPLVYEELRRLAAGYLAQERPGHTLQPTALVHEAFFVSSAMMLMSNGKAATTFSPPPLWPCGASSSKTRDARSANKRGGEWNRVDLVDHADPRSRKRTNACAWTRR